MSDAHPRGYYFVCIECEQSVGTAVPPNEFKLCAACLMLPGWHTDPVLRAKLGPDLPPLEEVSS